MSGAHRPGTSPSSGDDGATDDGELLAQLQREHDEDKRIPFAAGMACAAGISTASLLAAPDGATRTLLVGWGVIAVAFVVIGGSALGRRLRVGTAERAAWCLAVGAVALHVVANLPTDVGFESGLRLLAVSMVMTLGAYVTWPLALARRLTGLLAVVATSGLLAIGATAAAPAELWTAVGVVLLVPAVCEGFVARTALLQQVTARARAEADMGRTDQLTGLPNRRGLLPRLAAVRPGDVLLLVDVDHFKRVNDQHGHDVGDAVLRRVAGLLGGAVRDGDALGRWGGEEFVAVAGTGASAVEVAERVGVELGRRLCAAVREDAAPPHVTVSIGVAAVRHGDADWQEPLRRADACLYVAKADGRNRVVARPEGTGTVVL